MTRVLVAEVDQVRRAPSVVGVRLVEAAAPAERPTDAGVGGGVVLALRGDAVVARAGWTAVVAGTSEIVGVATEAAERRRGLGALVVTAAVAAAAHTGADLVWLRADTADAQRLYTSLGFEPAPEDALAADHG